MQVFYSMSSSGPLSLEFVEEQTALTCDEVVKAKKCSWKREVRQGRRNQGDVLEAPSSVLGKKDGERKF